MSASTTSSAATGRPTEWATPMVVFGEHMQTLVYASFISAVEISSKTREEVFEVTCAPTQCATEVPKQTITQRFEMMVCPGEDPNCEGVELDTPKTTMFGYPLGWNGAITADGTTTEWNVALSMLRDNERSSGATRPDMVTLMATTKVGKEVKATTSTQDPLGGEACPVLDNYAVVSVTAGVSSLLKDYPDGLFPVESPPATEMASEIEHMRSQCAKKTSGAAKTTAASQTDGKSGSSAAPKETGKSGDGNGSGRTSLSVALMGALLAISIMIP